MTSRNPPRDDKSRVTIGVLALQGAFNEHIQLLRQAAQIIDSGAIAAAADANARGVLWSFVEVRTSAQLDSCDALIIPGGESTTISLVAQRSNLLDPLRDFVKILRKPVWGTCAGLILLAESANRTKKGGQELIGGLDVRVNRNHFGRQTESFQASLDLSFLTAAERENGGGDGGEGKRANEPFNAIFIRAPVVERILPKMSGIQEGEAAQTETVVAPTRKAGDGVVEGVVGAEVETLALLPNRTAALRDENGELLEAEAGDIIAVMQGNVFGTSFHPELSGDPRIHTWWLKRVLKALNIGS